MALDSSEQDGTTGPLTGVTVVEVADFQTTGGDVVLAEMGADVIKVEDPVRGDTLRGLSSMYSSAMDVAGGRNITFETSNRSKRSVTFNLTSSIARELLYRLIDKADLFYTNYRPSVLEKLGIDYPTLSKRNPGIVYGVISAFGNKGPLGERRGYDLLAQGRSGLMMAMGDRDLDEPTLLYGSVCDQTAATMLAFGLLAGLVSKQRTGLGQKVEVSLYGSMAYLQSTGVNVASLRGRPWARHSRKRVREPMTNFYRCADSKWIVLSEVRGDEFWPKLAPVLGIGELVDDKRFATAKGRREHFIMVIETLDKAFAAKPLSDWLDAFRDSGLDADGFAYSPVFEYQEVLTDEQALANHYIVEHEYPELGNVRLIGHPIDFSATPARVKGIAPEHGQHTEQILLEELGLTWEEIADARAQGAI